VTGRSPHRSSPARTGASSFEQHLDRQLLVTGEGPAWRRLVPRLHRCPHLQEPIVVPALAEPQIVWVVRGSAFVFERELGESDWRGGEVKAGMFFLAASADPYELRWEALGTEPFEVLMLHLDLPLLRRAWTEHGGSVGTLRNVSRGQDAQLSGLLGVVRTELLARGTASGLLVEGVAQSLAVHLVRRYADAHPPTVSSRRRLTASSLRRVVEKMSRRLDRAPDLSALARDVGLSPSHLSRAFHQTTGETPSAYLLRLRMAAACRLLRETDQSVIQVALSVGYATQGHFTQMFRRQVGQTPTQYRTPG
jgi:AraC family transcriptional regulator